MKIVAGADWRDEMPFEVPVPVSDLAPGDDARCAGCPAGAPLHPRIRLWAVKHRHPKNHSGFVRFYCAEHRPALPPASPVASRLPVATSRAPRERAERRSAPVIIETPRALCPDCFVEVPSSGLCGMCGQQVG